METAYYPLKMKRKDLEDVNDEFSDFSLSSPARKIRRLDAELPPIIEEVEEEPEIPMGFEQVAGDPCFGSNAANSGLVIEELPSVPENQERAIVLFNPLNTSLTHSPSNFSVKLNPQFINGFKNQVLWTNQSNPFKAADVEEKTQEETSTTKGCLAVVPWVPSQLPTGQGGEVLGQADFSDMMDAEDTEGVSMDVEDNGMDAEPRTTVEPVALHQWQQQQQHCLTTQLPQNTSTPVTWYQYLADGLES